MELKNAPKDVPEVVVHSLLKSPTVTIRDTLCRGRCSHKSVEECTATTQLVFPYRGVYVRHVGHNQSVAEANQVLFFNAAEGYRISHPVPGGDGSLTLVISEALLHEIAPPSSLHDGAALAFRQHRLRIDPRAQVLVALLRHSLRQKIAEPLEAESLALTLVQRALGPRTTHAAGASVGRQRLVDRVKLVLASDLMRRWTLAEIAAEVRGSPVYLTQVFQQVEGLPLYRYQLRLRLGAGTGPSRAIRRPHRVKPGSWLLKPQSFQRRVSRSLWPLAFGIQTFGAASLAPASKQHH